MKQWRLQSMCRRVAVGLLMSALFAPGVYADTRPIDDLLVEAKSKHVAGDYEGAAKIYKQIIELDANHHEARKGLATVLIHAQTKEQLSEESDALKAVLDPGPPSSDR